LELTGKYSKGNALRQKDFTQLSESVRSVMVFGHLLLNFELTGTITKYLNLVPDRPKNITGTAGNVQ